MNAEEFKANNAALHYKIVEAERNRISAWLQYYSTDAELVTNAIKEGTVLTATINSELYVKRMMNASNVKTETKYLSFRNEARAKLGLPLLS